MTVFANPGAALPGRAPISLLALGAALLIGGCSNLPTLSQQTDLFTLSAPERTGSPAGAPVSWQLQVDTFTAPAGIDSASIAGREAPSQLDYYQGVAWADRAPVMVQRLLVEAFENSGRITGVGRDNLAIRANFSLQCELRDFQADTTRTELPVATVGTSCAMIRMPDREVIARTSHSAEAMAEGRRFPLIVQAFDRAVDDVLTQIVQWALTSGEVAYEAGGERN